MQDQITLNGKPAIKINATRIRATKKAILLNCDGDEEWFPSQYVDYNDKDKTAIVTQWIYKLKFPNG